MQRVQLACLLPASPLQSSGLPCSLPDDEFQRSKGPRCQSLRRGKGIYRLFEGINTLALNGDVVGLL